MNYILKLKLFYYKKIRPRIFPIRIDAFVGNEKGDYKSIAEAYGDDKRTIFIRK